MNLAKCFFDAIWNTVYLTKWIASFSLGAIIKFSCGFPPFFLHFCYTSIGFRVLLSIFALNTLSLASLNIKQATTKEKSQNSNIAIISCLEKFLCSFIMCIILNLKDLVHRWSFLFSQLSATVSVLAPQVTNIITCVILNVSKIASLYCSSNLKKNLYKNLKSFLG